MLRIKSRWILIIVTFYARNPSGYGPSTFSCNNFVPKLEYSVLWIPKTTTSWSVSFYHHHFRWIHNQWLTPDEILTVFNYKLVDLTGRYVLFLAILVGLHILILQQCHRNNRPLGCEECSNTRYQGDAHIWEVRDARPWHVWTQCINNCSFILHFSQRHWKKLYLYLLRDRNLLLFKVSENFNKIVQRWRPKQWYCFILVFI